MKAPGHLAWLRPVFKLTDVETQSRELLVETNGPGLPLVVHALRLGVVETAEIEAGPG